MGKILYLECNMGAAGDMLAAALYELLGEEDRQEFCRVMSNAELGIRIVPEKMEKCGVQGTYMKVLINGSEEMDHRQEGHSQESESHGHTHEVHNHVHGEKHHHHATLAEVCAMIERYPVSHTVQEAAKAVYQQIAAAESHAHGQPVSEIHFHEVGMKDAIADVLNVCWLMERLAADQIIVSAVNTGFGEVHCAHGILPVPAPATAFLLQGAPVYQGEIRGELCTPTGAALLQYFQDTYGRMPVMRIEKTGYGMGQKDFSQANCIRAFLGENSAGKTERIVELSCNLDDMSGEEIAFASELLREHGALDVSLENIDMKKNRPGIKLVCMCRETEVDVLLPLMLRHTTTWGVRRAEFTRYTLACKMENVETECGPVRIKTGMGYGVTKSKPEYEDLAEIARKEGKALCEVKQSLCELFSDTGILAK